MDRKLLSLIFSATLLSLAFFAVATLTVEAQPPIAWNQIYGGIGNDQATLLDRPVTAAISS